MIVQINTDQNFWELYPVFKVALSFKDLYKSDKSRGKESSSKVMWFIALCYSPTSRYRNLEINERLKVIGEDYFDNNNYYNVNKSKLDPLIEDFKKTELTPAQRHLLEWEEKIDQRSRFIASQDYDLSNFEDLDKMAANTTKIYDTFKSIKETLAKEEGEGVGKSGRKASLND